MAQPPFLVDQIQIEPGALGTRLIDRDPGTGAFRFRDAASPDGLLLHQIAGLRSVSGVYVVGRSGAGAAYTTIQAALDAIPISSSPTSPSLVLVLPGVYTETVTISRDGVSLLALGGVTLRSALDATPNAAGKDHTLILSALGGTIPRRVVVEGFLIKNSHTNKACVRVLGGAGSQVGSDYLVFRNCRLEANAAAGNRHLWATAANQVVFVGGEWAGNSLSASLVEECAWLWVQGLQGLPAIQLAYDAAQLLPEQAAQSIYHILDCQDVGSGSGLVPPIFGAVSTAVSAEMRFTNCTFRGTVDVTSNQRLLARNSHFETLTLRSTVAAVLANSTVATVTPIATATLSRGAQSGAAVFAAASQVAVTFAVPMPDANYGVSVELDAAPANHEAWWVSVKTASGFTLKFATNQTLGAKWTATRTNV